MLETINDDLNNKNDDIYHSPEELAKKFKVSLSSIYKLVRSGEIPSIRLGKIYRIPDSDLRQYLRKQRSKAGLSPASETIQKFLDLLGISPLKKHIRQIYLYGSYARGDYRPDSDIDLLVVIDSLDLQARKTISSLSEKAMASGDYREILSVKEESSESWEKMRRERYPLAQAILREGIPLWKNL